MPTSSRQNFIVPLSVTLPQIADVLRKLSKSDLETLEMLLDKRAMSALQKSVSEANRGKRREL